jgi:hypothetical protein
MKPYTLDFLKPVTKAGKSKIYAFEDLVFLADFKKGEMNDFPGSINRFIDWSLKKDKVDFLNQWPSG